MTAAAEIPHPFVDEVGRTYGAVAPQAPVVAATEWLNGALRDIVVSGLRPVVLTPDKSRLTFGLRRTLGVLGGVWVVHSPEGLLRDGVTGRHIETIAEAVAPPAADDVPDPAHLRDDSQPWQPRLVAEVTVLHKARADVELGRAAEILTDGIVGHDVAGWGVSEPAALGWSREHVTTFARQRMPEPSRLFYGGRPVAHTSGALTVTRTKSGVTETFAQVLGIPGGVDAYRPAAVRAAQALAAIADEQQPVLGTVSGTWGRLDGTSAALVHPPTVPLALLIGPRAVRDLRIDVPEVTARFGALVAGRPRIPALVVPFTGDGRSQWEEFVSFGSTLQPDALARAFGVPTEVSHAS